MRPLISRRGFAAGLLAAPASWFLAAPALRAQPAWPTRPLRFIVSAQVGGVSDIFVRLLEPWLREQLGQGLFVDPRPGGGGLIAADAAIRAADDHSFTVNHIASHGIGPSLYRNRGGFEPLRDMPGVARLAAVPNVLLVRAATPAHSLAELVALIRANPAKATYSSAGAGTSSHLGGVLLGQRLGLELTHVPYRGTAPSMAAVLNGEVLFNLDNAPVSRPHVEAGTLRVLGVSTAARATTLPDVPTLQEQGVADFDVVSWYGVAAPAATSAAVVARLAAVLLAGVAQPEVMARFRQVGAEPWPLATAAYNAFMAAEVARWAPVVRASGATVD